tara:strand:- start:1554 stop:2177 length:624 start_codon:yes stop_codon:yes gene_type:complete
MSNWGDGKSSTVSNGHTALGNGVRFSSRCAVVQFENSPCGVGGMGGGTLTVKLSICVDILRALLGVNTMKYVFILMFSIMWVSTTSAEPFQLGCKAKKGIGYRLDADNNGQILNEGFSQEGAFNSEWNFKYPGSGDMLIIDGKESIAFYVNDTLIAIEYAQNGMSQSLWSYAINLQNMEAVATQVNASNVMGPSLKGRTVSLSCNLN